MEEDSLTPEEELDLFQKDRRQNVKRNLIPAIGSGKMVVLDRYYFSTMAYQGAKGISPQRIREENETFAPSPDLVFIFDLDPDTGLGRIAQRGARAVLFEREDYLEKVRAIFLGLKGREFIRVDASRSIEEVAALIKKTVFRFLRDREGGIPNSFS
jgi:dTMP kinase